MNLENRIVNLMTSDIRALQWTQGWVAILLSMGFFFSATDTTNYGMLNALTIQKMWGLCFLFYGSFKLFSSLYVVKPLFHYFSSVVGFWLWSYVFLSFVVYDTTAVKSTEWMLVIPIVIEIWLCAGAIYKNRKPGC